MVDMTHLFNSRVRVEEMKTTRVDGRVRSGWLPVTTGDAALDKKLSYLQCRLDMTFLRPGKDAPQAHNAGKAPDRIGVLFYSDTVQLQAGWRIVTVPNEYGREPVKGVFEIKSIPDDAIDMHDRHHSEAQIIETVSTQIGTSWPEDANDV